MYLKIEGLDAMQAKVEAMIKARPVQLAAAMFAEGEGLMVEAKRRTPVDTGALRASGRVEYPVFSNAGSRVQIDLVFGGPAISYALKVHEDVEQHHNVGQDHYLSSVLEEAGAAEILAAIYERAQKMGMA